MKKVDPHATFPASAMNGLPIRKGPEVAGAGRESGRIWQKPGERGEPGMLRPLLINPQGTTTMNPAVNGHDLIVSGIRLELTPALKAQVQEKFDRLFRHEERIVRIRVELEYDGGNAAMRPFVAKGHIVIHGPDMNCSVASDECRKSVDLLVDKLDRMLRRRARLFKVKRKHPRAIELNAALPKTA